MAVYYNEFDAFAAAWLRELISEGLLPAGDVDTRSIVDVRADDLKGYKQCHFFAGIGGWPYALQLAGWGDRSVWTGSCPCQPFSSAARGRSKRTQDHRDLWPRWLNLIVSREPGTVFGEQIAQADDWQTRALDDLEAAGYEVGAAILPAVAVGRDHARLRFYFVGHANRKSQSVRAVDDEMARLSWCRHDPASVATAHGLPGRVGELRCYGNAIVPDLAAEFVKAYLDLRLGRPE